MISAAIHTAAQQRAGIRLDESSAVFSPENFSVSTVIDDRPAAGSLGEIRNAARTTTLQLFLEPSLSGAVDRFLQKAGQAAVGAPSLELHIEQLDITELPASAQSGAEAAYKFAFYSGTTMVGRVGGTTNIRTTGDLLPLIERIIRKAINNGLQQMERLYPRVADMLQPAMLNISVKMATRSDDKMLKVYHPGIQLSLNDFQGPTAGNFGAAATYSGIAIEMNAAAEGSKTNIAITLTITQDPRQSWFRPDARNARVLAHEQVHFDITGITGCALRDSLIAATFTPDNYQAEITAMYRRLDAQGRAMQDAYDDETNHGLLAEKQKEWSERIAALVAGLKCY